GKDGDMGAHNEHITSAAIPSAPSLNSGIAVALTRGDGGGQYSGPSFTMKRFKMNLQLVNNAAQPLIARFTIVIDDQPTSSELWHGPGGTVSTGYSILASNHATAQLVPFYPRRFRVLHDEMISLNETGAADCQKLRSVDIKLDEKVSATLTAAMLTVYQVNKTIRIYVSQEGPIGSVYASGDWTLLYTQ
ncbi:MAG: hypothetical protein H7835_20155, partial [Magnetococcus sp. XQGC-1]